MLKNAVIAMLIGVIYCMWIDEFYFLSYISLVSILFFAVWAVEDAINNFKRMKVFQRRMKRKIDEIKISPAPTKAS